MSNKVCKNWLQGNCRNRNCPFLHQEAKPSRRVVIVSDDFNSTGQDLRKMLSSRANTVQSQPRHNRRVYYSEEEEEEESAHFPPPKRSDFPQRSRHQAFPPPQHPQYHYPPQHSPYHLPHPQHPQYRDPAPHPQYHRPLTQHPQNVPCFQPLLHSGNRSLNLMQHPAHSDPFSRPNFPDSQRFSRNPFAGPPPRNLLPPQPSVFGHNPVLLRPSSSPHAHFPNRNRTNYPPNHSPFSSSTTTTSSSRSQPKSKPKKTASAAAFPIPPISFPTAVSDDRAQKVRAQPTEPITQNGSDLKALPEESRLGFMRKKFLFHQIPLDEPPVSVR
eukprot:GCRY01006838.1.p1 GENE.GCRY01006838.1~~GCRY01006838.1.p1  ORF type:complete len:328 (+),score=44.18 GCRY01006838.1:107-1090(+)